MKKLQGGSSQQFKTCLLLFTDVFLVIPKLSEKLCRSGKMTTLLCRVAEKTTEKSLRIDFDFAVAVLHVN